MYVKIGWTSMGQKKKLNKNNCQTENTELHTFCISFCSAFMRKVTNHSTSLSNGNRSPLQNPFYNQQENECGTSCNPSIILSTERMQSVCILLSKRPIPFVPSLGKMTATDQSLLHESKHTAKKTKQNKRIKTEILTVFKRNFVTHIGTQTQSKIEKASFSSQTCILCYCATVLGYKI